MTEKEMIEKLLSKEKYDFTDLLEVTRLLRSENGCPWDREQDHHSVRSCLIEETYEVVEAIDTEDPKLLQEELGDLLFQILFHAQMEDEKYVFSMEDVIHGITKKMIHRHPHVFRDVSVKDSADVLKNWETIKTEEKQRVTLYQKLCAIPPMMPALMRASKVERKVGQANGKSKEELFNSLNLQIEAMKSCDDNQNLDRQIGELLMTVTELAGKCNVDAEQALMKETERLIENFK